MKTDNKRNQTDNPQRNRIASVIIRKNDKTKYSALIAVLPVLSMLAAIIPGVLKHNTGTDIARLGIITLILTSAVTFYIKMNWDIIRDKKFSKTIIAAGYLGSICLLLFIPDPEVINLWMLGGLLTAMLVDTKLGMFINFNMVFILGILFDIRPQTIVQMLILCVLMSILSGALKDKSTFIYAAVIILSINITLAFAINNFIFDKIQNYNYLYSLFSLLAVLLTAFFLSIPYQKAAGKAANSEIMSSDGESLIENPIVSGVENTALNSMTAEGVNSARISEGTGNDSFVVNSMNTESEGLTGNSQGSEVINTVQNTMTTEGEGLTGNSSGTESDSPREQDNTVALNTESGFNTISEIGTGYELLCDFNHELLRKLKQFSDSLYEHAVLIGDLSGRAAKEIGANELLARAGGLYHEIGKLNGKNYIEEGLKLAEEYSFPKELAAILKEHNIKYEKPNSVEAAIVMLSDNVVSTIDYINKSGDHKFTANKIIDNIFQMRLEKGNFDFAGLTLSDFKKLKEFYQIEFSKEK